MILHYGYQKNTSMTQLFRLKGCFPLTLTGSEKDSRVYDPLGINWTRTGS